VLCRLRIMQGRTSHSDLGGMNCSVLMSPRLHNVAISRWRIPKPLPVSVHGLGTELIVLEHSAMHYPCLVRYQSSGTSTFCQRKSHVERVSYIDED
jgi:hypothetical protein